MVAYAPKNFEHLIGTPGFSDRLLRNHFKLYEGYVKNVNDVIAALAQAARGEEPPDPKLSELRRRFGWEFNGMRLHEYYFGNLAKERSALPRGSALAKKLSEDFFSFEAWKKDFNLAGAMRGIGWVVLTYDRQADRLFNVWINEHDTGHFAGSEPLLVMDVFEHAFMIDYGVEKDKYVSAFWNAVRWEEVQRRFEQVKEEQTCFGHSR